MEKDDKGSTMTRMGVSGWMFLLVPAYPGCPGSKAVKQLLLLLLSQPKIYKSVEVLDTCTRCPCNIFIIFFRSADSICPSCKFIQWVQTVSCILILKPGIYGITLCWPKCYKRPADCSIYILNSVITDRHPPLPRKKSSDLDESHKSSWPWLGGGVRTAEPAPLPPAPGPAVWSSISCYFTLSTVLTSWPSKVKFGRGAPVPILLTDQGHIRQARANPLPYAHMPNFI